MSGSSCVTLNAHTSILIPTLFSAHRRRNEPGNEASSHLVLLQEAVKLIWFLYLKHYGYAFSEDRAGNKRGEKEACTPSSSRGSQRQRDAGSGVYTPRKKRTKVEPNPFDAFPEDTHLFCDDSDSDEDDSRPSGAALPSGRELYMQRRSKGMSRRPAPVYFTLKHTIGLCYLALLYAEQNVMLSDFSRFVWKQLSSVCYGRKVVAVLSPCKFAGKTREEFGMRQRWCVCVCVCGTLVPAQ